MFGLRPHKHGREIMMRLIDGNGRVKNINIPAPFAALYSTVTQALVLINGTLYDVCKQVWAVHHLLSSMRLVLCSEEVNTIIPLFWRKYYMWTERAFILFNNNSTKINIKHLYWTNNIRSKHNTFYFWRNIKHFCTK